MQATQISGSGGMGADVSVAAAVPGWRVQELHSCVVGLGLGVKRR